MKIPFYRMGLPMFDRLGAGHQLSVGYRGTRDLIFDIGNLFMADHEEQSRADARHLADDWHVGTSMRRRNAFDPLGDERKAEAHENRIRNPGPETRRRAFRLGQEHRDLRDRPEGHRFLEAIQFDGDLKEDGNEDKLAPKIEAIKDCAILYVAAIGGSGAARVVANNIHPMKVNQPEEITDLLVKLEDVLKGTPPPWLRKALAKGKNAVLDFEE